MSTGPGEVLALIRRGPITRAGIQEVTGLSRVTVAQRVDALFRAGFIRESGVGRSTGGRKPVELQFDQRHAVLLLATVDTAHTRLAVAELTGEVLAEHEIEVAIRDGPEAVLNRIEQAWTDLAADAGLAGVPMAGAGVSLPAPVDPFTSRPSEPPMMPGWDGYPIIQHLRARLAVPVVVENDANAMALGEQKLEYAEVDSLCLVKVSTGIGCGIIINGQVYPGSDGGAGDIGHVRAFGGLDDRHRLEDALCQCGAHGCLAAVAGGRAVARRLTEAGVPAASGRDVRDLLAAGEPTTVQVVRRAGRRIGEVMAGTVCVLNPAVLLISGDLASTPLLSGIRETLYPRLLPRTTRNLEVRIGRQGRQAAFPGLAALLVDQVYGPGAINERLAMP